MYSSIVETSCQKNKKSFNIYPNPTTGQFFIEKLDLLPSVLKLSLSDALGKVVWTKQQAIRDWNQSELGFDLENLAKGIYFLKIDDGQKMVTKRLIKSQ